jgi:hypothetical protein
MCVLTDIAFRGAMLFGVTRSNDATRMIAGATDEHNLKMPDSTGVAVGVGVWAKPIDK